MVRIKNKSKDQVVSELDNTLLKLLEEMEETQQNIKDCKSLLLSLESVLIEKKPSLLKRIKDRLFNK